MQARQRSHERVHHEYTFEILAPTTSLEIRPL